MCALPSHSSAQSLWALCAQRSLGSLPPSALSASLLSPPLSRPFHLSASHRLTSLHSASVTSLAVDGVESRYLLSADTHGLVALYDTQPNLARQRTDGGTSAEESGGGQDAHSTAGSGGGYVSSHPLSSSTVTRSTAVAGVGVGAGAAGSSVNSCIWYPVDTGLFVTGGQDGGVHVWDTNAFCVEATFSMRDAAVNSVAMSPLAAASTHSLIAVASTDLNVRLCDVNSGGFAHTLIGHAAEVTCVCWTPFSEFILATASVDRVGQTETHSQHRPAGRSKPSPLGPCAHSRHRRMCVCAWRGCVCGVLCVVLSERSVVGHSSLRLPAAVRPIQHRADAQSVHCLLAVRALHRRPAQHLVTRLLCHIQPARRHFPLGQRVPRHLHSAVVSAAVAGH